MDVTNILITVTNIELTLICRFLHIAVAQGRRALAYVLAKKMASIGMLDLKERNNQVLREGCSYFLHSRMKLNVVS